jgi:hypothetical protein
MVEASVEFCRFVCLNGSIDVPGFGPEFRIQGFNVNCDTAAVTNATLPVVHSVPDFGIALFKERSGERADADGRRRRMFGRQVKKRFGEERQVAQIATEPADGVEGGREMVAAAPVADAERRSIACESAERGGGADRSTGVGSDGGDSRSFLYRSGGAAR